MVDHDNEAGPVSGNVHRAPGACVEGASGRLRIVSLISIVISNLWAKKFRSVGIAAAVALAVMTVVSLVAVSSGLENSAAQLLEIGKSDFTVEQRGVADIFYSDIHGTELSRVESTPGVKSAIGVLLENERLNASNPFFLEVGIEPADLASFGVTVVAGHPFGVSSSHQLMLGWRAAQNLGVKVGGRLFVNGSWNKVVGIFSTGIAYGDLGSMFPLSSLQAHEHAQGTLTLLFVKVLPGRSVSQVEARITSEDHRLNTITTASQFGRADQNITYLQAAATGSTVLAILIGAVIVGDSMLLSVFERTRELGLLRTSDRRRRAGLGGGWFSDWCRLVVCGHGSPGAPPAIGRHPARELYRRRILEGIVYGARDGTHRRPLSGIESCKPRSA